MSGAAAGRPAGGAAVEAAVAAVARAVEAYHRGIHEGDVEALARVMHPDARLRGESAGAPYDKSRDEYLEIVRARVSPAARGDAFRSRVLAIDVWGGVACARVFTPVGSLEYVDFLALVRTPDGYRIVSKVFSDASLGGPSEVL